MIQSKEILNQEITECYSKVFMCDAKSFVLFVQWDSIAYTEENFGASFSVECSDNGVKFYQKTTKIPFYGTSGYDSVVVSNAIEKYFRVAIVAGSAVSGNISIDLQRSKIR